MGAGVANGAQTWGKRADNPPQATGMPHNYFFFFGAAFFLAAAFFFFLCGPPPPPGLGVSVICDSPY